MTQLIEQARIAAAKLSQEQQNPLVQRGWNLDTPFKRLKPYLYKSS